MRKRFNHPHFFRRLLKPAWLYLLSRSSKPLSNRYGADRGKPLDRYYIENFLEKNKALITGRVLEVKDNRYTKRFGNNITQTDVIDVDKNNTQATIIDDLRNLKKVTNNTYDCIILTQVLQFIDDVGGAASEIHRILKPGGVVLATVPTLSRVDVAAGISGDFWRFTKAGVKYLFAKKFSGEKTTVETYGNVYAGLAFWIGQSLNEVSKKKLDYQDENFHIIVAVKAIK